jgi:hypothetical protein
MCDYSLMALPNRLAENGEDLILHRFSTGSRGFASAQELRKAEDLLANHRRPGFWSNLRQNLFSRAGSQPVPAVCIPPGSRLLLQDIPVDLQRELEVGSVAAVVFTELTAVTNRYRDAVRFQNGRHILLQSLDEGQRAKVLDLSSAEADEPYEEWRESRLWGWS